MKATVLVIEDNYEILENTLEILELQGYKALGAHNGKEGIEMIFNHYPDIVLSDIMMPEADGYEVLNAMLSDPKTAKIPFVFLTASVERKDVQAGFDLGAKGYVRKPFELEELLETIRFCLQQSA